jgi:hypothetical protein
VAGGRLLAFRWQVADDRWQVAEVILKKIGEAEYEETLLVLVQIKKSK